MLKYLSASEDFARIEKADLPPRNDVFSALGTTIGKAGSQAEFRRVDVEIPLSIAQKATAAGARQFLLVFGRCEPQVEPPPVPPSCAVSALPISGLQIFRPSALMVPRQEYRLGERIGILAGSALAPAMVGALRKYRPIHAEDVARAMVAISTDEREGRQVYEYDQIMRASRELPNADSSRTKVLEE